MAENNKNIVNFFFELGQLSKIKHSGWYVAGVKNPESIAEHVHRAAEIGYVLAILENANPEKVAFMVLIHDNGEARTLDLHRICSRYVESKKGEVRASLEQFDRLPKNIAQRFKEIYQEFEKRKTKEALCAKDADYLDQVITAKEYIDLGYKGCQNWIDNIKKALKTPSAKKLTLEIEKTDINEWWQGLKKLPADHV